MKQGRSTATHGVLRVVLKLDGETVIEIDCDIGYLHRGPGEDCREPEYTMIAPTGIDSLHRRVANGLVW